MFPKVENYHLVYKYKYLALKKVCFNFKYIRIKIKNMKPQLKIIFVKKSLYQVTIKLSYLILANIGSRQRK